MNSDICLGVCVNLFTKREHNLNRQYIKRGNLKSRAKEYIIIHVMLYKSKTCRVHRYYSSYIMSSCYSSPSPPATVDQGRCVTSN